MNGVSQDGPCSGFFKPHLSILESKVVGLTPKSSAAPSGPLIFQLAVFQHQQEVVTLAALELRLR